MTPRHAVVAGSAVLIAVALMGCSADESAPQVSGAPEDWYEDFVDSRWRTVEAADLDLERPDTEFVAVASWDEFKPLYLECMHSAGFENTYFESAGYGLPGEELGDREAEWLLADYVCDAAYPLDPTEPHLL